jgi:hypothetical protein
MKPVLVIWNDAHAGTSTWERIEDLVDNEPYEVKSVGFLMTTKAGGKRSHVSITQSWSADGCVDSVLHIPAKMVVRVINLAEETYEYLNKTGTNSPALPEARNPTGS